MPVNPIVPKRNSTAGSTTGPVAAALQSGELASNTYLGRLYLKKEDNSVKVIGSDASELTEGTMPAGRLPALTGDVTSSAGSSSTTLAASGVTAGTYGSGAAVPVLTFDAKGRATAASTVAITAIGIGAEPAITTLPATKLPALTGDVSSSAGSSSTTVGKLQGRTVASTAPTAGQVLAWNASSNQWEPSSAASGSTSVGGDLSGTTTSATVAKIQGRTVASTAPTSGQVLAWNDSASQWEPSSSAGGGITALTGDVTASGTGSQAATVARIQGRTVASTAPTANQALAWNATSSQWEPVTLIPSAAAPVLTSFTGDGSTTLFAISGYTNTNPANYLVVIGGVPQRPHSSVYTVSSSGVQLSAAPANGVAGFVLAYQAPTGASPLGYTALNAAGDTLTGALNEAQGANIASASTVNLTTATGNYVQITGTTTITAITLAQGAARTVVFAGALTLTNGASLILPTGANITTDAGDSAVFRGEASGVVRCVSYTRASGQALASSSAGAGTLRAWVNFNGTGTVAIRASGNVSSITDNGTGDYTINFTTAMPDANYSVAGLCQRESPPRWLQLNNTSPQTTTAARLAITDWQANAGDATYVDVSIFR